MKFRVTILLISLLIFDLEAQHIIKGIVLDGKFGGGLPGTEIDEVGTSNGTITIEDGTFQLTTESDSAIIEIRFIGYNTETISISSDTSIELTLAEKIFRREPPPKYFGFGIEYDATNSLLGISFSNRLDEKPLLSFEEIGDYWMYKIKGIYNVNNDFSFKVDFGAKHFRGIISPTISYEQLNLYSEDIILKQCDLSFGLLFEPIYGLINFEIGYNKFQNNSNFGLSIGLSKTHYNLHVCYGFMIGYYIDYFRYNIYLKSLIFNGRISLKTSYENIDNFNLLNFGVGYMIMRKSR